MLLTHDAKFTADTITETESEDLFQIISDDNPSGGGFQFHDTTDNWKIVENYYRTGPHGHCSLHNGGTQKGSLNGTAVADVCT